MGKQLRLKEAKRRAAEHQIVARLLEHSRTVSPSPPAAIFADFPDEMRAAVEQFRHRALRPVTAWRAGIRSRSVERRYLELVRFAFARYPAPRHLEAAWTGDPLYRIADDPRRRDEMALPALPAGVAPASSTAADLRHWHILVAQGGSLHREATGTFLTKAETHHFVTAPAEVTTAANAFWYAIARAAGANRPRAVALGTTKLADFSAGASFWREAARYFVRTGPAVTEVNDLVDFLAATRAEDPGFSLKGRSLEALRRRMEAWHRALRKANVVCGGSWAGHPLADAEYETGSAERPAVWRFRQIRTGNDLFREGQRMHHCVVAYKGHCMAGLTSIWSLTSEFPLGHVNRGLTLELRPDGSIVQARGFANRLPHANEAAMIRRWASEHRLEWSRS